MLLFFKEFLIMRRMYFSILIAVILLFLSTPAKAQTSFSVGINISSQPIWGPVGYDDAEYYYLPDIDVYYYVPQHLFFFQSGDRWISSSRLPSRYHNYNLYNGYKVVINADKPYMHDQDYRQKYSSYKNRHDQQPIRDSRDSKYYVIKNHPEHNNWVKQQGHSSKQGNKPSQGNKSSQANRPNQANNPSQGTKPSQGNKPNKGNKPSQGNKPNKGNKPSQGNKPNKGNKPSQGNKQEQSKEHGRGK
jgi:hypothetical protein